MKSLLQAVLLLLPALNSVSAAIAFDAPGVLLDRVHHLDRSLSRILASSTEENALEQICAVIETAFDADQNAVQCDCAGTVANSLSISCKYTTAVCHDGAANEDRMCGKPQIAVSMVDGRVFSATSCVSEYYHGLLPLQDTCVFVDACRDSDESTFCGCTASYGSQICGQCQVCESGRAITVDCSNVNPEAITRACTAVDLDLDLVHGAGAVAGFAPVWDGFCSQLEKAASPTNNVACDCSSADGASNDYDITCSTKEPICLPGASIHCGQVASNVKVVGGAVQTVTACADYLDNKATDKDDPFAGQTCTEIALCDSGNSDSGNQPQICGCRATFDGDACHSCEICADGASLTLDCSNVRPQAVIAQCQPVSATSAYEFLPRYLPDTGDGSGSGSNVDFGSGESASVRPQGALLVVLLLALSGAAVAMLQ